MFEPGEVVRYAGATWTVIEDDGLDRIRIRRVVNGGSHVATLPASHVKRPYFYGPDGAVAAGILVAAIMTAFLLLSVGCQSIELDLPAESARNCFP